MSLEAESRVINMVVCGSSEIVLCFGRVFWCSWVKLAKAVFLNAVTRCDSVSGFGGRPRIVERASCEMCKHMG